MPSPREREDRPTVELSVEFTGRETDAAYQISDAGKLHWIPFSQTVERHNKGGSGTIVIYEWIAKEKGLI